MAYDKNHKLSGDGLARVWAKIEENFAKKDGINVDAVYSEGDKVATITIGEDSTDIYVKETTDINIDDSTIVKNNVTGKIEVPIDNSSIRINSDGYLYAVGGAGTASQSDWNETDETSEKFIANKPFDSIDGETIVSNDGVLSAVVSQVQSDWNETSESDPAFIKNKPVIASTDYIDEQISSVTSSYQAADEAILNTVTALDESLSSVAKSGSYTDLSDAPEIPSIEGLATEEYVDDAIDAVNELIPEGTAKDDNMLVNKEQLDEAVNMVSKDQISSNGSATVNPFDNTTYVAKLNSSSVTVLELGPWYKNGKSCGYINSSNPRTAEFIPGEASLSKGDWTIVQHDESLCYCFIHDFKYQRIKDGGATTNGTVRLPDGTSALITPIMVKVDGVSVQAMGFTDASAETVDKVGHTVTFAITNVVNPANSIIEYYDGDLNIPIASYDLSMPTVRYTVSSEAYEDEDGWHAPLWSYNYTLSDSAFTTTQLATINSTLNKNDVDKIRSIEDGAQKNVQSDWNETDEDSDSFILNKPGNIGIINDESESETEVWSAAKTKSYVEQILLDIENGTY